LNELDSSLRHYDKAKKHWSKVKKGSEINYLMAFIDGNRAQVFMKQFKYEEAIHLLEKDARVSKNENINNAVNSWLSIAECYYALNNYSKAKIYCDSADAHITVMNSSNTLLINWYSAKAKIYKELGRKDDCIIFLENLLRQQEIKEKEEINIASQKYAYVYDVNKKQEKIEELKIEKLKGKKAESELNQLRWITVSIIVFVVLLLLSIIIISILQRKIRNQLKEKKKQTETSLKNKEMLLKEIHHRVKNNLQIVSSIMEFQNISINDEKTKLITKEGQNRIQSMALIHENLYESERLDEIDSKDYLEGLLGFLSQAYQKKNLDVSIQIVSNDITLGIDTAVPFGLIVNELVTNCFKYAFYGRKTGNIVVSLISNNNKFHLSVKGNGVGLPIDFDLKNISSLGLDLVQGLSRQLNGKVEYKINKGTEFMVSFYEGDYDR
jgi:two-component sensor histidine kinase